MEQSVRKLRALADATSLRTFDKECEGIGSMLESLCRQPAEQPPRRRGGAAASRAGAGGRGPLLPALAAACSTGLRLLFPRGAAPGWVPQAAFPTAPAAVALLAGAFQSASGIKEGSSAWPGGSNPAWPEVDSCPAWPNDALMRMLQQTGGRPMANTQAAAGPIQCVD